MNRKTFFTADPHFFHNRDFVYAARGYSTPEDHTEAVLASYNEVARADDDLYVLGDLTLNCNVEQFERLISRIICQNVHLMMGNHPNPHRKGIYQPLVKKLLGDAYTPETEMFPLRYKNIIYINHQVEIVLNGQLIFMSHFPHMSWNQLSHGAWMLCGHEHGGLPASRPEATDGKILDLGWDLYKKPLSFAEVKAIMDKKNMCSVGHHVVQGQPPVLGAGAHGTRPA